MKTKVNELHRQLKVEGETKCYCFSQNYINGVKDGLLAMLEKFKPGISKGSEAVIHLDASNIGMLIEVSHSPEFDIPEFVEAKAVFGGWMQLVDKFEWLVLNISLS